MMADECERVTFRCSQALRRRLRELAARKHTTVSRLIRRILENKIGRG